MYVIYIAILPVQCVIVCTMYSNMHCMHCVDAVKCKEGAGLTDGSLQISS